jgi:serine phosphatase RsbU (regulator of sigma subunit)
MASTLWQFRLRTALVVPFVLQIVAAVGLAGYGIERLCEVVSINWHKSAEQIKQSAIEDLRGFIGEQKVFDDITLVVLNKKD